MAQTFERLDAHNQAGRYLCVGLDPDPEHVARVFSITGGARVVAPELLALYATSVMNATRHTAAAYKAQFACWAYAPHFLKNVFASIREVAPGVPCILDGKFGDIGNTMGYWADFAQYVGADAVTANPYMGIEDVGGTLAEKGLDVFFLASTSNTGSEDIQRTLLRSPGTIDELVAGMVNSRNREGRPYGLVIGGTRPVDLVRVMTQAPRTALLVPGIGAQGGDVEAAVGILKKHPSPWTINVSRGISEALKEPTDKNGWFVAMRRAAEDYASQFRDLASV